MRREVSHQEFLGTKYFGALDGLRALSIVMVIGFHCGLTDTSVFKWGQYGVSLFFVISGFLITTLLLRERDTAGQISLKNFYIRRTLRIFPLYYAAILIYTALVIALEHGPERGAFFRNLPFYFTYTSNWFVDKDAGPRVIFAFSWSLATEEQFYLIWPGIVRFARRWWIPLAIILSAACCDMFFEAGIDRGWVGFGPTSNRILTSIATPICLGCGLAYLLHSPRGFGAARLILARKIAAPLALVGLALAYHFYLVPLMLACMVLLVGACCIRSDNGLWWMLANPVVRYIGTISYGLYLLHMLAMNATRKIRSEHDWIFLLIAFAISIALASASYWMFELPFLRLKNRFKRAESKVGENAEVKATKNRSTLGFDPIRA
jgi:peptidoglycan/LPS O-acetylase OafA/YrhL